MKYQVHPSAFSNQPRVHLNSGIYCLNNLGHFCLVGVVARSANVKDVTRLNNSFWGGHNLLLPLFSALVA
jgi:hypothetical protein